jgi:hypothetical protein
MVTIILGAALLIALTALAVEVGIASWNIRRANKYRRRADVAEYRGKRAMENADSKMERIDALGKYASKVSWLLDFLYRRYDFFKDIEKEIENGLSDTDEPISVEESEKRYKDLEKAMKIIRVTVKASERVGSIVEQARSIIEDFENEDGCDGKCGCESKKSAPQNEEAAAQENSVE